MERTLLVAEVTVQQTRNGNRRFVVRGDDDSEYTTFRPAVGEQAQGLEGRRARIQFHEEDRNGFHNVYLDAIEALPDEAPSDATAGDDTDPDEVAWRTAVEAAPYLVGERKRAVAPDELFDKLKPFKERVVDDIRDDQD